MSDDKFALVACARDGTIASPCERAREIDQACAATAAMYDRLGFDPPWIGYIAISSGTAVGGGAFVGAPADNRVEIAYFTLADHRRTGVATQIAGDWWRSRGITRPASRSMRRRCRRRMHRRAFSPGSVSGGSVPISMTRSAKPGPGCFGDPAAGAPPGAPAKRGVAGGTRSANPSSPRRQVSEVVSRVCPGSHPKARSGTARRRPGHR